jgi:hypothetical protein
MTMRCKNGQPHTHETVAEARVCWTPVATSTTGHLVQDGPEPWAVRYELDSTDRGMSGDDYETMLASQSVAKPAPATEGMYRLDGHIYRVQFSEAGHLYARRLNLVSHKFEMARGVVAKLDQSHRLTLAEAKEFGRLTGVCVRCGRDLFVPESVAAGIGPKCATLI